MERMCVSFAMVDASPAATMGKMEEKRIAVSSILIAAVIEKTCGYFFSDTIDRQCIFVIAILHFSRFTKQINLCYCIKREDNLLIFTIE